MGMIKIVGMLLAIGSVSFTGSYKYFNELRKDEILQAGEEYVEYMTHYKPSKVNIEKVEQIDIEVDGIPQSNENQIVIEYTNPIKYKKGEQPRNNFIVLNVKDLPKELQEQIKEKYSK